ncbi:cysteine--tRNA ligase [Trueperella bialowiezensis]|uniref:Cysteine--tRNA ligase n=1 Tax=Trueperella bialowiezensis TaxID=312285 RepID=A0A448PDW4_9ACTO|nr:cysteine--tRNA ligase [Trueperella bialowiezensis]VEI13127.1 Cysteine--tRNA ligase [Trueperella bialowiezensis]
MKIFDSKSKSLREFEPLEAGKVGIYLCGATVQGSPHIGHMRSALAFDVLIRWLRRSGYDVTFVRNVTDIDDKILAKSAEAGRPWWALAYRYEKEFTAAYRALGVVDPTYEPRATGHVPEMIEMIERLIERGHAYVGEPGNVYFDVASLPDYGSLTNQSLDDLTADDAAPDKRSPHDFALWKAAKPGEPDTAAWNTPWGRGRPGWHLECSAMAGKYLGEEFDIHAGGIDLRFPHHENEQAQSHGAGYGFANYWMHNAWVTIEGEKMSKSLGNSLTVANILAEHPAVIVRLALGTVHYRSTVAYSESTLTEAEAIWERLAGFVERAVQTVGEVPLDEVAALTKGELPAEFVAAMDDDLNVPAALAVIHEHVTQGNNALADSDHVAVREEQLLVRAMLDVLGLDPLAEPWRTHVGGSALSDALDALVSGLLEERQEARAAKDWARADALRDSLAEAGIVVEDSAEGARWKVGGELG